MRVALTNARRSPFTGEWITAPHEGLLSIAASLREGTFFDTRDVTVTIVDEQLDFLENPDSMPGAWLELVDPDVVGIQAVTATANNAIALAGRVREVLPDCLVVMGGVHPTQAARALCQAGHADVVVQGEGEATFAELLSVYRTSSKRAFHDIPGLSFRDDGGATVTTAPRPPIRDLDRLPPPARDLVDMAKYARISPGRSGNLITSRGCSYACAYCFSRHHWGRLHRRRSVDGVIREMEYLHDEYGMERFRIEDDDFMEDRKWVTAFCSELQSRDWASRLEWDAKARPDHLDDDLAHLLRRSGCFRLLMGVETLNDDLLRRLNRGGRVTVHQIDTALSALKKNDVSVQATLVLGIPGEPVAAMRSTLDWLDDRLDGRDLICPCFFMPFYSAVGDAMHQVGDYMVHQTSTDYCAGHFPITSSESASLEELTELFEDYHVRRRWRRVLASRASSRCGANSWASSKPCRKRAPCFHCSRRADPWRNTDADGRPER